MTMLLDDTTPPASRAAGAPASTLVTVPAAAPRRPMAAPPLARRPALPTAALLRLVDDTDDGLDLVPAGIALHVFTEPLREHRAVPAAELHRATTVLTKQVKRLLTGDDRLAAIEALVTDPGRQATPDGRTAATLCGRAWPAVVEVASRFRVVHRRRSRLRRDRDPAAGRHTRLRPRPAGGGERAVGSNS